jgi:hypothetical protein
MAIEKISVSVPADVAEVIRASAADAGIGVSAWLTAAAREKAASAIAVRDAVTTARELLSELEGAHGPATEADLQWVAEVMSSAGLAHRAAG